MNIDTTQLFTLFAQQLDNNSPALCENLLIEAKQQQRTDRAAHMGGQLYPTAITGQLLATLHQGNLLSAELYPQLQQAESRLLADMTRQFCFPYGHFTAGGSTANLEALWLAKQRQPYREAVYASENCHYSVAKACALLDLQLILITTDAQHQMEPSALEAACAKQSPLAIIATAGTTGSGHLDPLRESAQLARQYQSWLHIDAAWGGFLALLGHRALLAAINKADSMCFDPHKSLGQPRPCGLLFYRHPLPPVAMTANYLPCQPDSRIAGSRGAETFLPFWLTWYHYGLSALQSDLNAKLTESRKLAELLRGHVNPLLCSESGIICFQHSANLQSLVDDGVLSVTQLKNQHYYRLVFADRNCCAEAVFNRLRPYL
jgi:glutamate/tyrosine decarboxylase-like PLP-dependent enzyme